MKRVKNFQVFGSTWNFSGCGGGGMVIEVASKEYPNQKWSVLYDTQSKYRPARILRPVEFELLLEGAKTMKNQVRLKVALITGMRYKELRQLHKHPEWYNQRENFILITETKPSRKQARRYIRLPDIAREILFTFFSLKLKFPSHQTWEENLKRWAVNAGISPEYLNSRATRKTWESWLTYVYRDMRDIIVQSQGHTAQTSLDHYLNIPFTEEDLIKMRYWVQGWDK